MVRLDASIESIWASGYMYLSCSTCVPCSTVTVVVEDPVGREFSDPFPTSMGTAGPDEAELSKVKEGTPSSMWSRRYSERNSLSGWNLLDQTLIGVTIKACSNTMLDLADVPS